jgi:hypothetical protein
LTFGGKIVETGTDSYRLARTAQIAGRQTEVGKPTKPSAPPSAPDQLTLDPAAETPEPAAP